MLSDHRDPCHNSPLELGVPLLELDLWTERRRALATAVQWLRSQDRAFESLPSYAASFLEAFQTDLREQLRWEESVPFPYLRGLLDGGFCDHVEKLVEAHHELDSELSALIVLAHNGVQTSQLPGDFGTRLRAFLDTLTAHSVLEGLLWSLIRPATGLREWPDGPGRSLKGTEASASGSRGAFLRSRG